MIKEFGKVIIEKENITVTEFSFEGSNGLGGAGLEALLFAKEKIDAEIMDIFNRNIPRLTARIAELEDAARWIPVGEKLPELNSSGLCSNEIEVAYRYKDMDQKEYYRKVTTYWKKEGFQYGYRDCKFITFDYFDFVVDYYRYLPELPELIKQDGDK